MEKMYKYRIYPNKKQQELIQKTFGCCRFVYNYYLSKCIEAYEKEKITLTYYDCCKMLSSLKEELPWLKEPDKCSLQNSLKDLNFAYKRFFNKITGYPNYKKKKTRNTYRTQNYNLHQTTSAIRFENNHIKLPKLGWIKVKDKRPPNGRILNATIEQKSSGKYYVCLCCTDIKETLLVKTNKSIGIDLGIKTYATTSNGEKYTLPESFRTEQIKLAKLQKDLFRKTRGSSNWRKARIKLARQYEKISNQRNDYLQKLSTQLIKDNDIVCIETLAIDKMVLNKYIGEKIKNAAWFEFGRLLQYKADWYGKKVIKIDRFFPSSQICNNCGYQNSQTRKLYIRSWICPCCNAHLDRDVNAALNILNEGLKSID